MVHGQIISVSRNTVQYGQPYQNGDIVQMPDYLLNKELPVETGICEICQVCGQTFDECDMSLCGAITLEADMSDDYAQRWYGELVQPIRTRERARCYSCKTGTGRMRRVIGHFITAQAFDPTQAYRMTCGHTTIDC